MDQRIQHYRAEAARLRQKANKLAGELRRQFLDVATQYDQLADSVERRTLRRSDTPRR